MPIIMIKRDLFVKESRPFLLNEYVEEYIASDLFKSNFYYEEGFIYYIYKNYNI